MRVVSCMQGHAEPTIPEKHFAWKIDKVRPIDPPMVDIKGAQGLWLLSEEARERLKASEFKDTHFVQKQKITA